MADIPSSAVIYVGDFTQEVAGGRDGKRYYTDQQWAKATVYEWQSDSYTPRLCSRDRITAWLEYKQRLSEPF